MTPAGPPNGRLAVFPGSFDPLTNGHVDIILRSTHLFERVLVAVLVNAEKQPLFTADERVAMVREVFRDARTSTSIRSTGCSSSAPRRGVPARSSADCAPFRISSEFQMALMNRHLEPGLETVFMMPAEQYTCLSSRLIKEVFQLGGQVKGLVPPAVERWLGRSRH